MKLEDAATKLECSTSKVSRLENGKGIPRDRDVRDLIDLFGAPAQAIAEELYALASDSRRQGWWDPFRKDLDDSMVPEHLARYVALETDAVEIRWYEPDIVPGLLQTRDYVAAVIELYFAHKTPEQRAQLVEFRLARQAILTSDNRPAITVVMGEAATVRAIGGTEVLRRQLAGLGERLENGWSQVGFHIAPASLAVAGALGGPFSVLMFPDEDEDDVVYAEGGAGATYVEAEGEVEGYKTRFSELVAQCPDRNESITLLKEAASRTPASR